jgi:centromeric protein E
VLQVFAYGQTSSGKTHTLIGTAQDPGTLPVAIHDVFHLMSDTDKSMQFLIRVSYMEVRISLVCVGCIRCISV